jgi:hypothetical protein
MANIFVAVTLIMNSILFGVALALGTVGWTMAMGQMYERESQKNYGAAARDMLRERQAETEKQLAEARAQGDKIAEAEAEVLLATLHLVEERYNPAAVWRQEEQRTEAFREDQKRQFRVGLLLKGLSMGAGTLGFGKVSGSYIRGTNWPPDPSKSVVIWDPKAAQWTRIMLQGDQPILKVTEFSDNLEDFLKVLNSSYGVATSATQSEDQEEMTGEEVYGAVKEALERIKDMEPLPDILAVFISESLKKQALADNPQIAGLSSEERDEFLTDQACKQMQEMVEAESDVDRSDVLRAADQALGCSGPVAAPGAEEPEEEKEAPAEEIPEEEEPPIEEAEEQIAPPTEGYYSGTFTYDSGRRGGIGFYVSENGDCRLELIGSIRGDLLVGTHENGTCVARDGSGAGFTATFNKESVSGSGSSVELGSFEFSGSRER